MFNIASFLQESARLRPDKVAVCLGESATTYERMNIMAGQVAGWLMDKGIEPGDKIALSCPNIPYFPVIYYGILKAGAVVVPLNVLLKAEEIAYHLQDSEAKAIFAHEGTPELPIGRMTREGFEKTPGCRFYISISASQVPCETEQTLARILGNTPPTDKTICTQPLDTAVILYTSGTTGRPKGAELTHFNMAMNAIVSKDLLEKGGITAEKCVFLGVLPLFHSFGQTIAMNAMVYSGAQITMLPRFSPAAALQTMLDKKVTTFAGVPSMYWGMLNEANKWPPEKTAAIKNTLQLCVSGGAAMPVELLQNFEKLFGVDILEGYGLSETSPVASFNHLDRKRKVGSIGEPIWGVEMCVVDEDGNSLPSGGVGELVIRGHNVMKGYYKRPQETAEVFRNGWFFTGDMARMDEEGYFFIVDRKKDMIIRKGYNVYPREIEEKLLCHPAISMAAVVGVADPEKGEEVKAYIILKENEQVSKEELQAWCKENMANYKYPRIIEIRKELPLGPTGKILKRELR